MAKTVKFEIELDSSGAVKGIKNLDKSLDKLDDSTNQAKAGFKGLTVGAMAFANIASQAVIAGVGAMVNGFKSAVETGQRYESTLAELSAITGIAGDDLAELGNTAIEQAKLTGMSIDGQIEAYKLLASNIDVSVIGGIDGLKMLGEETVRLSQASGVDLATASNTVASAINQFGLEATKASDVVNILSAGSKFGASEVGDLGESLKNTGTVASLAGLSLEDTVGALEVLSQNALKGAEAGTGLRNTLMILQSGSAELAELGITPATLKTQGLTDTLAMLEPILSDSAKMTKIFGRESSTVASILVKNSDNVAVMTERVTGTSTALEQARINTNTFANAQNKLSSSIEGAQIKTFERFKDELLTTMDVISNVINNMGKIPSVLMTVGRSALEIVRGNILVLNGVFETAVDNIGLTGELLWEYLQLPFKLMTAYAEMTFNNLRDNFSLMVGAFKAIITGDFEEAGRLFSQVGENMADNFVTAFEDAYGEIIDKASEFGEELAKNETYQEGLKVIADSATEATNAIIGLTQATKNNNEANSESNETEEKSNAIWRVSLGVKKEKITVDYEAIKTAGIQVKRIEAQLKADAEYNKALNLYSEQEVARNDQSIQSAKDVANAGMDAIRQGIQARIAEAVATQISNVVKSVPFPFNLAVIPLASAGLSLLMNKLIPKFETGGMVGGRRHSGGGTLIEAEQGEFIVNRNSTEQFLPILEAINSGEINRINKISSFTEDKQIVNRNSTVQFSPILEAINSGEINRINKISSFTEDKQIVNRNSTEQFLPILEAINSGVANRGSQVNELVSSVGSMNSGTSAQISALASAISNIRVSLSMFELNEAQRQFNQVQIAGGVL